MAFPLRSHSRGVAASRSTRCPAPSRQGEPFNFSRQMITHTRRSSRFGRAQTASRLRVRMRWSIAPTDEFVGVCGCLDSADRRFCGSLWVSGFRFLRYSQSETASRLREQLRWSIAPTDDFVEFVGVWIPGGQFASDRHSRIRCRDSRGYSSTGHAGLFRINS